MSKFAVKFFSLCIIGERCLKAIRKVSNKAEFVPETNTCVPTLRSFMPIHSLKSTRIPLLFLPIQHVFSRGAVTQIGPAIVQRIVINVIHFLRRTAFQNQAMHVCRGILRVFTPGHETSPSGVPHCSPIPPIKPIEIIGIDNRILSLSKWDESVRLIERLSYRMSFHAVAWLNAMFGHRPTSSRMVQFSRYFIAFLTLCTPVFAQNFAPTPFVKPVYLDNNGKPAAGGCISTFVAGTTTPHASYADSGGLFVNPNPVILDSAGRANIFLDGTAYKIVLTTAGGVNCALGSQLWSVDNIQVSPLALLSLNNSWSGTQTFNGAVTFNSSVTMNSGFTSSGPSVLNGGGTIAGTWAGNPVFSGTPAFNNGFTVTALTLSGQLTSTLVTGTAPFVIASTTKVVNLNVDQVDGCDFAIPCPIGSTTPNTAIFTTLQANTSLKVNGSPVFVGASGTGTNIMSGGTVAGGAGTGVCLDANNAITTSGCTSTHQVFTGSNNSICTTGGSTYSTCDNTITFSGTFASSSYRIACMGIGPSDGRAAVQGVISRTTTTAVIRIVTEGSVAITYNSIECTGTL